MHGHVHASTLPCLAPGVNANGAILDARGVHVACGHPRVAWPGGEIVSCHVVEIRRLTATEGRQHLDALAEVLLDCVRGGASVSFMASLTKAEARSFF